MGYSGYVAAGGDHEDREGHGMNGTNALVVYYSRTGTTAKVGRAIADRLGCRAEEIIDTRKRTGIFGFLVGAYHAYKKKLTEIEEPECNPASYDLVVVGTPVWAGTVTPAVRTYLHRTRNRLPPVAFFLTTGGTGIEGTLE